MEPKKGIKPFREVVTEPLQMPEPVDFPVGTMTVRVDHGHRKVTLSQQNGDESIEMAFEYASKLASCIRKECFGYDKEFEPGDIVRFRGDTVGTSPDMMVYGRTSHDGVGVMWWDDKTKKFERDRFPVDALDIKLSLAELRLKMSETPMLKDPAKQA